MITLRVIPSKGDITPHITPHITPQALAAEELRGRYEYAILGHSGETDGEELGLGLGLGLELG